MIGKIKKYMNLNVQFTHGGPVDTNIKRPEKKYFDFLSRNFENYDKYSQWLNYVKYKQSKER